MVKPNTSFVLHFTSVTLNPQNKSSLSIRKIGVKQREESKNRKLKIDSLVVIKSST